MNRKEEMELFPENADERRMFDDMAKTLGGPLLVIANAAQVQARCMSIPGASFYETGLIHHNELIKAHNELAALRASAAPEEGIDWKMEAERANRLLAVAPNVRLEARPADDSEEWTEIFPAQLEWVAKQGHQVRAIESALPSDSGKAAPVTGHPVERLWRAVGLPEYFLGNGGSNTKLYELYAAIRNELHADLRALAPATEIEALRAGLQLRIDQINPLVAALEKAREYVASFPYSAGSPAYLKQCSTLIEIDRALSPPSVGTPEMTSANQLTAAPIDPETPTCSICGARLFDPCRTIEQANKCELPPGMKPGVALSSTSRNTTAD